MLASFLCGEFLLHILSWLLFSFFFYLGSFSHISRLASFLLGQFLLHIPCWLKLYMRSFSYTSCAGFIFMRGVSLTHPVLTFFFFFFFKSGEFLLYIPSWLYFSVGSFSFTSHACLIFLWGDSLTDPMLFFCAFFLIWGVFLTHPVLASYLCG